MTDLKKMVPSNGMTVKIAVIVVATALTYVLMQLPSSLDSLGKETNARLERMATTFSQLKESFNEFKGSVTKALQGKDNDVIRLTEEMRRIDDRVRSMEKQR